MAIYSGRLSSVDGVESQGLRERAQCIIPEEETPLNYSQGNAQPQFLPVFMTGSHSESQC